MNQQAEDWGEVVSLALAQVADLSDRKAGERLGISFSTVNRWRVLQKEGLEIPEPRGDVRAALERFMGRGGIHPAQQSRPDESERLEAGDNPAVLAMMYEARAAVLRAEAAVVEAKAAQVRAEALRAAEMGAYARAATSAPEGAVSVAEALLAARAADREPGVGTPAEAAPPPRAATG